MNLSDLTPAQRHALASTILADLAQSLADRRMADVVTQLDALALVDPRAAGIILDGFDTLA